MSDTITQALPVALYIATGLFAVTSILLIINTLRQSKSSAITHDVFSYTVHQINGIANDIQEIPSRIVENLRPQLQGSYIQQTGSINFRSADDLPNIIRAAGFQEFQRLQPEVYFSGSTHNGLKISQFFSFQNNDLVVNSFSFWIAQPSTETLKILLHLNASHKTGNIGIRKHGEKFLVFVDISLFSSNSNINIETLKAYLYRQAYVQDRVATILRQKGVQLNEILLAEYLTLPNVDFTSLELLNQTQQETLVGTETEA